ncbi:MAG: hypothetical protein MO852_04035 [Candidatus Devosia euplotis]|nr:hypothetical protein [Candidatus Devosia euplotis]
MPACASGRAQYLDRCNFSSYIGGVLRGDFNDRPFLTFPVTDALWQQGRTDLLPPVFSLGICHADRAAGGYAVGLLARLGVRPGRDDAGRVRHTWSSFWLGLTFMQFFAVKLSWFDTSGYGGLAQLRHAHAAPPGAAGGDAGADQSALITRFTHASMLDVLSTTFSSAPPDLKGMGLDGASMGRKHALKNADPHLTVIGLTRHC